MVIRFCSRHLVRNDRVRNTAAETQRRDQTSGVTDSLLPHGRARLFSGGNPTAAPGATRT